MRIALFTDIHGNREAFAACLAHAGAERHRPLRLPRRLRRLRRRSRLRRRHRDGHSSTRGAIALLGNHDAARADRATERMNDDGGARDRLDADAAQRGPARIPRRPAADHRGGRPALRPRQRRTSPPQWDYVTRRYAALAQPDGDARRHATFCGHTHVPALFHMSLTGKFAGFDPVARVAIPLTPQRRWLAVIGAVGQPRDRNPAACYALLDDDARRAHLCARALRRRHRGAKDPRRPACRCSWARGSPRGY